jgi:hypothetical protein
VEVIKEERRRKKKEGRTAAARQINEDNSGFRITRVEDA